MADRQGKRAAGDHFAEANECQGGEANQTPAFCFKLAADTLAETKPRGKFLPWKKSET
jgi:hypothetical protein